MNKAIILDRDSTLVHDPGYVHKIEDFRMLSGVVEGMKLLSKTDYKLIIVSNQAGIGKEVHTEKDTQKFNEHLKKEGYCLINFWISKEKNFYDILRGFIYHIEYNIIKKFKKTFRVTCSSYTEEEIRQIADRSGFKIKKRVNI